MLAGARRTFTRHSIHRLPLLSIQPRLFVMSANSAAPEGTSYPYGLDPKQFKPFKLVARKPYNHNTAQFVFQAADSNASGKGGLLPVSSCMMVKFKKENGEEVIRPYTPISVRDPDAAELHFLIKDYPTGVMSRHLHTLPIGETVEFKGPMKKKPYEANKWKNIGMIAGGTGITPMLQVCDAIFSNPEDKTHVTLLFCNSTLKDVLLRERLDELVKKHPDQFKVIHAVTFTKDEDDKNLYQESGHVTREMLEKYMPKPADDVLIYTCGPPGFMALISGDKMPDKTQGPVTGLLKDMGYTSDMVCKQ